MPALALTDNGNMYGAIDFYKKCKEKEIKPILGIDAYVAARTRFDKEPRVDSQRTRIVLLSKNKEGYQNLLKIVSKSYLEGFYYKPRVDYDLLEEHNEGLIAIIPSFSSEPAQSLRNADEEKAKELTDWYLKTYGDGNVYFEITHHPEIEGHPENQEKIKEFAKKNNIPLVAGQEVYYLSPDDHLTYETLLKIQSGGEVIRSSSMDDQKADFSFISPETAKQYFSDTPEAIKNTTKIADKCEIELTLGEWIFPDFQIPEGTTYDEQLKERTYKKVPEKGLSIESQKVVDRIEYELDIISQKGFSPYFLIVSDMLQFARSQGILSTTRGSGAGSIVCYINEITNIDPLEFKLPFERFLNPDRPKAPDIDMDFADDRRDEVIQYARDKYGEDKVAQIGTFGTMLARGVVRDVARALGYPYSTGDKIARLIPGAAQGFNVTIEYALEEVPELSEMYKNEEDVREIVDMAQKIEGCARHISVHAAGVVISPSDITDYVPVQFDPKGEEGSGKLITQYNMHGVEDVGLIKFDFLGIRNLSILADSVKRVKQSYNIDINIENIPIDDEVTFKMLARGETMGVFQLSGSGMTRYLRELMPNNIHDINAMIALYRPGPMESIPSYIERKQNPHLISYLDPRLKDILHQSYGVVTYQDDVMLIAINLAGYSWLEADDLRKAMGKKIPEKMAKHKEKLKEGFVEKGMTPEKAEQLWKLIEPFASYGFNKAHAASYGKVAYQTAYMKANYPVEYMAALLSADAGEVEKISESINECIRLDIPVLPPNINESFGDFTVVQNEEDKKSIRFGLNSIKNFGEGIAATIINEREVNGKYKSITDFLERIKDKNLNRKSLESLIKAGALDGFEERGKLLHNIDSLLEYNKENKNMPETQNSLFAGMEDAENKQITLEEIESTPQNQKLAWEKELLGLYISGHPLDEHQDKIKKQSRDIHSIKNELKQGMQAVMIGLVENPKVINTKKGDRMMFFTISDYRDKMEVVMFPSTYEKYKDIPETDICIALKGRLSARGDEMSVIADAVKKL